MINFLLKPRIKVALTSTKLFVQKSVSHSKKIDCSDYSFAILLKNNLLSFKIYCVQVSVCHPP